MTLEQIWTYLSQNPMTFNKNKTSCSPRPGLKVGSFILSRFRNCYYITQGNKSIKVSYDCYKCVSTGEVQGTWKGRFFQAYCGFEESIIGKHFVRLDDGGTLKEKHVSLMQPLIDAGIITTIFPVWYRPFIDKVVTTDGKIKEITKYGRTNVRPLRSRGN